MAIEVVGERQGESSEVIPNDRLGCSAGELRCFFRGSDGAGGKERIEVAESTHAATRFVNIFKTPAAWVALLAAELVGVRPVCTKLRAGILSCCSVPGEGSIRMHCEN